MNDYKAAKRHLVNPDFFETLKYHEQKLRAKRFNAHPQILEFERKFISRMKRMNIPLFTVFCYRGSRLQDELYEKGVTLSKAGQSPHNYAMAVDIVHSTMAWKVPPKCWDLLGHIGKEVATQNGIDIQWGGDWENLYDPAHWQLTGWRRQIPDFPDWAKYTAAKNRSRAA